MLDSFGEEIRITKGKENEPFKYYIRRYHNNGICTLISGCNDDLELIEKLSGLITGKIYEDDLK